MISSEQQRDLDERGFLLLPGFIEDDLLDALRGRVTDLFEREGEAAGAEYLQEPGARRLANLVDKGEVFQRVIAHPRLRDPVARVLGGDYKLSSLNVRSVPARCAVVQPLHCDMAAVPDARGFWVCNTVWMLDEITRDNGAIRVVPGSHVSGRLPKDALSDPAAPHPDEILLTGAAGTVVVMNAHVWHGGIANRTDRARTALHAFFCRRDKPQQQYQKALLRSEVQAALPRHLRDLLALDDPVNDAMSAAVKVRSGFMK